MISHQIWSEKQILQIWFNCSLNTANNGKYLNYIQYWDTGFKKIALIKHANVAKNSKKR